MPNENIDDYFAQNEILEKTENNIISENKVANKNEIKVYMESTKKESKEWYLKIDKINLNAEIQEGTDEKTLDNFIGHFSSTPVRIGNVGLAAHNRGYKNNYFKNIKELEKGDKIIYVVNGIKNTYIVDDSFIIHDTDWSNLENTKEDMLTLITCVENREEYRLCVQAIKEKGE